jgi:hypothetical protein
VRFQVADDRAAWRASLPANTWPTFVHHREHGVVARLDSYRALKAWLDEHHYHPDEYTLENWR